MKRSLIKFAVLFAFFGPQTGFSQVPSAPSKTLQVIAPNQFCSRLTNILASYALGQGLERRDSLRLANKASQDLVRRLGTGSVDAFLNVSSLKTSNTADVDEVWLSVPDVVVSALGFAPERVLIVEQANDLKFTSHVMPGAQLLFMASDIADLNSDRIKRVSNTAKALGIKIHVVWLGRASGKKVGRISPEIVSLAANTEGAFVDLSAPSACGAY